MTKRLIATLLVAALMLSVIVVPAGAEKSETNVTAVTEQCPCGCGPISQADWKPYNINDGGSAMGHYYLEGDYAQEAQKTVISDSDLIIDLRGHTLTTDGYHRLFLVEGYLAVLDTVGGGRFQAKTSGSALGGVMMVRMNETNGSTFELFSGTVAADPDNKGSSAGGLIYLSGDKSTFRMHGGVLSGGNTNDLEGKNVYGGAIAAVTDTAEIDIRGGTIMDCSTASYGGAIYSKGTTKLENCRIINCTSAKGGGAIYQSAKNLAMDNCQILSCESTGSAGGAIYSKAVTTLTDCEILQCTAASNGGNIYQNGSSLTMENCDIAYGTANGTGGGGNCYIAENTVFTDKGSTFRDGAAYAGSGGNLYMGGAQQTLTGTAVLGGVSNTYGANIVCWTDNPARFEDCRIDGDVRWGGDGLVLAGKTKIGLRGNGLNLVSSSTGSVVSASQLTDGAEVYVSAHFGTFTSVAVNVDYFKPALRTVMTQNADGTLSGKAAADGELGGYCPHCNEKVSWQGYTASSDSTISQSGHYYLTKAVTARLNIAENQNVVIDLNGKTFTSGHRCFVMKANASLSILDFNGAGKVTGSGGLNYPGGVIYGETAYTLNIYGGTFTYKVNTEKHVKYGGVIRAGAGSRVNIYGGSFNGSEHSKTDEGYLGGTIYMANGTADNQTVFRMSAGRIIGGTANSGGAVSFGNYGDVEITGGMISGGTAAAGGGNIRAIGTSSKRGMLTMKNCAVVDGISGTSGGGNINNQYYSLTIENCYLANGTSTGSNAGNINHSYASNDTVTDSVLLGGTALRGGNVYVSTTDGVATYTNCQILCGTAVKVGTSTLPGCGGNVRANNGRLVIVGGEIAFGKAEAAGGNAFANSGSVDLTEHPASADDGLFLMADPANNIPAPVITDGYATTRGGNIYINGICELTDAVIDGGRAVTSGQDIYFNKYTARSFLTVGAGVTGDVLLDVTVSHLGTPIYGNPIACTAATTLNANITLENEALPVFAHDGKLFIGGATVVDAAGEEVWYVDNAQAVAACGEQEYVKLYTGNELTLTKDLYVDLNGQTVAVSGSGKLLGMDSSGDGYALPTGKTTGAAAADITRAPNGNLYLPVTDGDSVTYHRLGMAVTDIALRTADAGLYYKAAWSGDSVLQEKIAQYGIVVSLADMPDADFRADETNLSVDFNTPVENGTKQCGVVIKDILKQTNQAGDNDLNGRMSIFATAYVTLTDGTTYVSDAPGAQDDIVYSLYDFMEQLDGLIQSDPTNFRKFEKQTKEFYAAWEDKGLADWEFKRLKAPQDPADDNEFNVLMVGSSFCSYYMTELWSMLDAAGYENVHIYNVYYSGCWVEWHYNWWKQGESNYSINDANGPVRYQVSNVASLEYCLSQANWDVISLQESSGAIRSTAKKAQGVSSSMDLDRPLAGEQHFDKIVNKCGELLDYFHSEFPQARIFWHQTWSYQIGYDRDGYAILDTAQQVADMNMMREFALRVCDRFDYVERVPTGEAWQVCREDYGYDNLCDRLGVGTDHEGDYYHDGDIGGGQLLNASVWYEIITGQDCRENTFVPSYTYDGETVANRFDPAVIKSAAHEAVAAMRAGN